VQVLGSPTLDGLPGLVQVAAIDGHVFLVQTGMSSLRSLNSVSTIGRSMVLIGNHNLTELSGMDRLSSVGTPPKCVMHNQGVMQTFCVSRTSSGFSMLFELLLAWYRLARQHTNIHTHTHAHTHTDRQTDTQTLLYRSHLREDKAYDM
jgi:hypothetical protein